MSTLNRWFSNTHILHISPIHIFCSPWNGDSRLKWPVKDTLLEPQSQLLTLVPYVTRCLLVIKDVCVERTSPLSQEWGVMGDKQKLECTKQYTWPSQRIMKVTKPLKCKAENSSTAPLMEVYVASDWIISREPTAFPDSLCCWLAAEARMRSSMWLSFIFQEFHLSQGSMVKALKSSMPGCVILMRLLTLLKPQGLDL